MAVRTMTVISTSSTHNAPRWTVTTTIPTSTRERRSSAMASTPTAASISASVSSSASRRAATLDAWVPNDGNSCTIDMCFSDGQGNWVPHQPMQDGTFCPHWWIDPFDPTDPYYGNEAVIDPDGNCRYDSCEAGQCMTDARDVPDGLSCPDTCPRNACTGPNQCRVARCQGGACQQDAARTLVYRLSSSREPVRMQRRCVYAGRALQWNRRQW